MNRSETIGGATAGTPTFMAPEQFLGAATDARTDQFSFCASLWEALCGELPFADGTIQEIRAAVVRGALRAPARALPRWLLRALQKGLSLLPEDRFQSLSELLAVLRQDRERRLRRALAPSVVGLLLLAIAGSLGQRLYLQSTECARAAEAASPDLWGPGGRASVARALSTVASAQGKAILTGLDAKFAQWREQRTAACERAKREPASAAATLTCLERFRTRARVAAKMLAQANGEGDASALLLDTLGSPRRCTWVRPVQSQSPASEALREQTEETAALVELGRAKEAAEKAQELIPRARAEGALALAAELGEQRALALADAEGAKPEVLQVLRQAVRDADASGDDERSFLVRITSAKVLEATFLTCPEAEESLRDADAWLARLGRPPHLELHWLQVHATVASDLGRNAEAYDQLRRALALCEVTQASARDFADVRNDLAGVLNFLGRPREAEQEYERAIAIDRNAPWRRVNGLAVALTNLGYTRLALGRPAEALASMDEAKALLAADREQLEPYRVWIECHRAGALEELGRLDEAGAIFREVLANPPKGMDATTRARALAGQARILLGQGQARIALPLAQEAMKLAKESTINPRTVAHVRFTLARVVWEAGGEKEKAEALALAREALAVVNGPDDGYRRGQIESWLAQRARKAP